MSKNELYVVRRTLGDDRHFQIIKTDLDFNYTGKYTVGVTGEDPHQFLTCDCYAGTKQTCRHRQMVEIFQALDKIDKGEFYHFDKNKWIKPPQSNLNSDDPPQTDTKKGSQS